MPCTTHTHITVPNTTPMLYPGLPYPKISTALWISSASAELASVLLFCLSASLVSALPFIWPLPLLYQPKSFNILISSVSLPFLFVRQTPSFAVILYSVPPPLLNVCLLHLYVVCISHSFVIAFNLLFACSLIMSLFIFFLKLFCKVS